ncbi:DUF2274 domain-containing protein [Sphingobium sp.]|uniref:DUF2274 domain-containing protein n=1 Tax=Sphingobium sp. TaxID=1912891 RepID=UPI000DAFC6AB|nr:DUF2274 domain-containing protein [Sphingobium sp.]PZU69314.1 MAG: DUF2274 domain-containing protein [Sphingobium sp.]
MGKLRLSSIIDEKPIKLTLEIPALLHRDLIAYAEVLADQTGQSITDPAKLIAPMVQRFIATDRGFAAARRRSCQDQHGASNLDPTA